MELTEGGDEPVPDHQRRSAAIWWAVAAGVLASAALGMAIGRWQAPSEFNSPPAFVDVTLPPGLAIAREPYNPVMSPDGRYIAFAGETPSGRMLHVRSMVDGTVREIAGPITSNRPFWYPDSTAIVFAMGGGLWRAQVADRQRVRLGVAPPGNLGASVNAEGTVIFGAVDGIYRFNGDHVPIRVIVPRQGEGAMAVPVFLPDGMRFLFTIRDGPRAGIVLGRLDSDAITPVLPVRVEAQYVAGHLVYALDGQLIARRLQIDGSVPQVGEARVLVASGVGGRTYADANGDRIAFSYGPFGMRQLVAFQFRELDVDPRGDRLAVNLGVAGEPSAIAVMNLETGGLTPVTDADNGIGNPRWGEDDRRVFFNAVAAGKWGVFVRDLTTGELTSVRALPTVSHFLDDVSADGRQMLFHSTTEVLSAATVASDAPVRIARILNGVADQSSFSPDMRYVAFNTSESGRPEVVVVPSAPDGRRWQISRGGGAQAQWSRDGRELFFLTLDGTLMAVPVPREPAGWNSVTPAPLFQTGVGVVDPGQEQYVVAPDGRFFVTIPVENAKRHSFGLLLGWRQLLNANN
jgi:hypothetical protein